MCKNLLQERALSIRVLRRSFCGRSSAGAVTQMDDTCDVRALTRTCAEPSGTRAAVSTPAIGVRAAAPCKTNGYKHRVNGTASF